MVIELVKKPRLAKGDYGELVRTLKKCMGDSIIFVVINAATIVASLANGLRGDFAHYTTMVWKQIRNCILKIHQATS